MNKFNDHQIKLWKSMIKQADQYLENKIEYNYLVASLESLLDASEIKDKNLVRKWYDHWGRLEIHNAVSIGKGKSIVSENVKKDVEAMRQFLINEIKDHTNPSTT